MTLNMMTLKTKIICCLFFILNFNFKSSSQTSTLAIHPHADFLTAIEIKDSIAGPYNVSFGYGKRKEFRFDEAITEDNSIWFKFTIHTDTLLSFDIVPKDSTDDYDFMLFKCGHIHCIDSIASRKITPDRLCFSVNYSKGGATGLSEYASKKYVGPGLNSGYLVV